MNVQQKEEREFLKKHITNYDFIREGIYLDLDLFCFTLSCCFYQDGVDKESLSPDNIYDFTLNMCNYNSEISEYSEGRIAKPKITHWDYWAINKHIYKNGTMTQLHVTLLTYPMFLEAWIYNIGRMLVTTPHAQRVLDVSPDKPTEYFDWVLPEWRFVNTFITGLHNAFWDWMRNFDTKNAKNGGHSMLEALATSRKNNQGYDIVLERLRKRNEVYRSALKEISNSIQAKSYTSAVSLEENIITNCLKDYLIAQGLKSKKVNFKNLLHGVMNEYSSKISKNDMQLFKQLDEWRIQRNKIIHGGITEYLDSEDLSLPKTFAKQTAYEGFSLCEKVCDWYYNNASMFFNPYRDSSIQIN